MVIRYCNARLIWSFPKRRFNSGVLGCFKRMWCGVKLTSTARLEDDENAKFYTANYIGIFSFLEAKRAVFAMRLARVSGVLANLIHRNVKRCTNSVYPSKAYELVQHLGGRNVPVFFDFLEGDQPDAFFLLMVFGEPVPKFLLGSHCNLFEIFCFDHDDTILQ